MHAQDIGCEIETRRVGYGDEGIEFRDPHLLDGGRLWHKLTDTFTYKWATETNRCAANTLDTGAMIFYALTGPERR